MITIISAFSSLAGAGGAPLAAIALGQGNKRKAERILGNVFTRSLCVFTIGVMAVFYAAEKPFLYLVGASDATYPYASAYLRIYLIGTFFVQIVLRTESVYYSTGAVEDGNGIGANRSRV